MPWSAKARSLIREQYATTGAAANAGLTHAVAALCQATGRLPEAGALLTRMEQRHEAANQI
jgi:hypothetical protein